MPDPTRPFGVRRHRRRVYRPSYPQVARCLRDWWKSGVADGRGRQTLVVLLPRCRVWVTGDGAGPMREPAANRPNPGRPKGAEGAFLVTLGGRCGLPSCPTSTPTWSPWTRSSTDLATLPPVDATWVCGDIVGYGPQPNEVIARLREIGALAVMGNHDGAAVGVVDPAWFNDAAAAAISWTTTELTADSRAFLADLPERRVDGELTAVHGSPRDPIWEYITSIDVARANLDAYETRICLFGHTHLPIVLRRGRWRDGRHRRRGRADGPARRAPHAQSRQRGPAPRRRPALVLCRRSTSPLRRRHSAGCPTTSRRPSS